MSDDVPQAPVPAVRYVSINHVTLPVVSVGLVATLFILTIRSPINVCYLPVDFVLLALMSWLLYREPMVMETHPDGLYMRSVFGNSRLIPYARIRRVAVGGMQLRIHTTSRLLAEAQIAIEPYAWWRKHSADTLIFSINQAAHLTKFGRSRWGWLVYDREA